MVENDGTLKKFVELETFGSDPFSNEHIACRLAFSGFDYGVIGKLFNFTEEEVEQLVIDISEKFEMIQELCIEVLSDDSLWKKLDREESLAYSLGLTVEQVKLFICQKNSVF